jgi:hypothetical protein
VQYQSKASFACDRFGKILLTVQVDRQMTIAPTGGIGEMDDRLVGQCEEHHAKEHDYDILKRIECVEGPSAHTPT